MGRKTNAGPAAPLVSLPLESETLVWAGNSRTRRIRWIAAGLLAAAVVAVVVTVFEAPPTRSTERADLHEDPVPRLPQRRRASWRETDNPARDGWETEAFHVRAKKQLAALGNLLAQPGTMDAEAVAGLITDDYAAAPLLPRDLTTVFEDRHIKVERVGSEARGVDSIRDPAADAPSSLSGRGAKGMAAALRAAAAPFTGAKDLQFEFKVFDVRKSPGEVLTRQYFSISGQTESGVLEQHATWDIRWAPGDGTQLPRVRSIHVKDFEQSTIRQTGGALFADCTRSVLGDNATYADQFLHGMNHWFERIQETRYYTLFGNPGLAVGDVNGDGLDDLYVCQETGLPNRLFIQQPDGTAREASAEWGVDWLESSRSALLVDLDNDSDQDLVVAILGGVVLAENDGQQQFDLREVLTTADDTMSLSAADIDRDGRLDLYVCVYHGNEGWESAGGQPLPASAAGFVVHDAHEGGRNSLFRNEISADGTWKFTDITRDVGLDVNNHRWSFAAAWEDFDNDGDQDLYVANDFGRDSLYRNDPDLKLGEQGSARTYVDIGATAHIEDSAFGMSISWGDYDRDGSMDAYVANMWSAAGNRIAFQNEFKPEAAAEIKRRYRRLARGNTLLRNQGDGTFADQSSPAGVAMGRWSWCSNFVDVNNDGWEDLVVANGFITTENTSDL